SVWLLLDFFLIIVLAAIGGGNPGAAFLLFIPIIALLFAMRRISGSTARLVLLILVIVFANLQIISIGGLLFVGVVLVALFVLGVIILELMRDLRSFFDYFALRHRVIQRVRQADPVVYVPEGEEAVERAPARPALDALKAAVEGASMASRIPPARIQVLWQAKGDESVTPDVYEFLTKEAARVRLRGHTFVCSLELAVERDDGTYDFIPLVLEPATVPGGRPTPG